MIARPAATFVVRIWIEPAGDGGEADGPWRATITDTRSRERFHFSEPDALYRFLIGSPVRARDPVPPVPILEAEGPP